VIHFIGMMAASGGERRRRNEREPDLREGILEIVPQKGVLKLAVEPELMARKKAVPCRDRFSHRK
jgi:hypothetical protein